MSASRFLPWVILFWAAMLRLWNIQEMGLSHDEFSAYFRAGFDTFTELIEKGVLTDTHPAGVQVFLWFWLKIAGESPLLIRLPFILLGIASIALSHSLSHKWFGKHTALWVSAFLAVTQIGVLMSQLARPYSPGLFFVLFSAWSWERHKQKQGPVWLVLMALSLAASAYTHYFALLQAAMLFAVLFVFETGRGRIALTKVALSSLALFLPYLPGFLKQLSKGGIGTVLGPPDWTFAREYIFSLVNFSFWLGIPLVAVVLSAWTFKRKDLPRWSRYAVPVLAFTPALIGTLYSIFVNPVLMERSLYFSMPFLLMVVFSVSERLSSRIALVFTGIFLVSGTYSLVFTRQHYSVVYDSGYRGVLRGAYDLHTQKGYAVYLSGPADYLAFEARYLNIPNDFYTHLKEEDGYKLWFGQMDTSETVVLGRTMQFYSPDAGYDAFGLMQKGSMQSHGNWLNADLRSFGGAGESEELYRSAMPGGPGWELDTAALDEGKLFLTEGQEWGLVHKLKLGEVLSHRNNELGAVLEVELDALSPGLELVSQLWKGEELVHYSPVPLSTLNYPYLSFGMRLADISQEPTELEWRLVLWNRGLQPVRICRAEAMVLPGNPLQYCWSKPLIHH